MAETQTIAVQVGRYGAAVLKSVQDLCLNYEDEIRMLNDQRLALRDKLDEVTRAHEVACKNLEQERSIRGNTLTPAGNAELNNLRSQLDLITQDRDYLLERRNDLKAELAKAGEERDEAVKEREATIAQCEKHREEQTWKVLRSERRAYELAQEVDALKESNATLAEDLIESRKVVYVLRKQIETLGNADAGRHEYNAAVKEVAALNEIAEQARKDCAVAYRALDAQRAANEAKIAKLTEVVAAYGWDPKVVMDSGARIVNRGRFTYISPMLTPPDAGQD